MINYRTESDCVYKIHDNIVKRISDIDMLGRRNYQEKIAKSANTKNRYSIRKLSVGAVSAIIGFSILGLSGKTVHATTTNPSSHQTNNASASDEATQKTSSGTPKEDDNHTWQMGNDEKTYDGQSITQIDVKDFHLKDHQSKELNTESVSNDSFVWTDAKGNPIVDQPKNVGTYHVKLTDSAAKKLQQDNQQSEEQKGIVATYTIKQGQATATLKGYDSVETSSAKESTVQEKIKQDKRIYVDLKIDGSNENRYDLQEGDYTWSDVQQSDASDPTNAGTYHLSLTEQGKTSITKYINSVAGYGTEVVDGIEHRIPNVKVAFAPSTATLYIYDQPKQKPNNLPKDTVWTPAGWTRTNPDYVAKNATVNLYNSGKANFESNKELNKDASFNYTTFGADITATIAKEDLQISNKILLATITATNDYTDTVDGQLPLTSASSENGQRITDSNTGKIIGTLSVTNQDNGEIDYWLNVTDTDTYGEDVKISNLKDYNAGYLNHHNNFDKLAKLSKNGTSLKTGDTITQTISTASNTYVQKYKVSEIGTLLQLTKNFSKTWANTNKPVMTGNYYNPILVLSDKTTSKDLAKGIQPQDFTKAFLIEGENIDFSNLSTWERLTIYGINGQKLLREKSNTVDEHLLDKNKKTAFKLSNNLSLQDAIAQTPDGESAYSVQENGGAIVVVKVKAANIALTDGEITSYVKSSQFYNLQTKNKEQTLKDTTDFYHHIGDQPIEVAVMIGADFADSINGEGWGTIHDITPNVAKAAPLKNDGVKYEHGKAIATGKIFRTAKIDYYDAETGENLESQPRTVLTGEMRATINHTINIPLGYKFDHINNNGNISDEDLAKINNEEFSFDYHFFSDSSKNNPVKIYLKKIRQSHAITYTVIDTDDDNKILTQGTQLPDVYLVDGKFTGETNSNQSAAEKGYQQVLTMYEKEGYRVASDSAMPDWNKLKDQNYNFEIKLAHNKIQINTEKDWPAKIGENARVDLTKKVIRKITVSGLPGIISPETQVATFNRTATVDQVTGSITTTDWQLASRGWGKYQVDGENVLAGFAIKKITVNGQDYANVIKDGKSIVGVDEVTPQAGDADIQVKVVYEAVKRTVKFVFVDDDENQKQIKTTEPITQQIYSTYQVEAPTNYDFKNNQDASYYFAESGENKIIIHLVHHKDTEALSKTATRTINVERPDGSNVKTEQEATINGTRTIDRVTNATTKSWKKGVWAEFNAPVIAGYTATIQTVERKTVDGNTNDETVNVSYKADPQTVHIIYQDQTGNTIKTDKITGVTDQNKTITPVLPTGWILTDNQNITKEVTFNAESNPDIVISVKHNIVNFTHDHPVLTNQKTSTNAIINGGHETDLTKTITRTIAVINPNGDITTIEQVAKIYRDGSYDDVTGEVTYSNWSTDDQHWTSFVAPEIAGYTADTLNVEAETVNDQTENTNVQIKYAANDQATKIIYQDDNGQIIHEDTIFGVTDQQVTLDYQAPEHWQIVGDTLPTSYQFKAIDNQAIIVKVAHKLDPRADDTKTITRTITIVDPDGREEVIKQEAKFSRSHQYDEVLGQDVYGNWDKSTDSFAQVDVPKVKAFTPSQDTIKVVNVTPDTADSEVKVTYTENVAQVNFAGQTTSIYGEKLTMPDLVIKGYSVPELAMADYVWYDEKGNELNHPPVNAGTYTVKLKDDVLAKLNQANDDYHFNLVENAFTYQIALADLTVTLTGQDRNRDEKRIDLSKYQIMLTDKTFNLNELEINLDDLILEYKNGQSNDSIAPGKYTIKLSEAALSRLQQKMPNYKLSFASAGEFEKLNTKEFNMLMNKVT